MIFLGCFAPPFIFSIKYDFHIYIINMNKKKINLLFTCDLVAESQVKIVCYKVSKEETKMAIMNFTPHSIIIINPVDVHFDANIRKNVANDGYTTLATIPSAGMLSAKMQTVAGPTIDGIPSFVKSVTGVDPLPDDPDAIFVVSALYASAYRKTHGDDARLYTIADPVYTPDGKTILGSLGICPAF